MSEPDHTPNDPTSPVAAGHPGEPTQPNHSGSLPGTAAAQDPLPQEGSAAPASALDTAEQAQTDTLLPAPEPEERVFSPEVAQVQADSGLKDTGIELAPEPEDLPELSAPSRGPLSVLPIPAEPLELERSPEISPTPPELNPALWDDPSPDDSEELLVAEAEAAPPSGVPAPAPETDELLEAAQEEEWESESPAPDPQPLESPVPGPQSPAPPPTLTPQPALESVPAQQVSVSWPAAVPEALAGVQAPEGDLLEEVILPSTTGEQTHPPGERLAWGGHTFEVGAALPRGWYEGHEAGTAVLLRFEAEDPYPRLPAHRLTPRPLYAGPEGYALPALEGHPYGGVMPFEKVLHALIPLAQYVYALEKQGYALLDLDPSGVLDTPEGPRLRVPPRLGRIGERVQLLEREGYTAPELRSGTAASGREGVYLLGALLLSWLSGESPVVARLEGLRVPGVPQILYRSLTAVQSRFGPLEFLNALRALTPRVRPQYQIGHATSVGLNPDRPVNEDSYAFRVERVGAAVHDLEQLRVVVCDGMGGMAAGEVASGAAVRTFLETATDLEPSTLERAVWSANRAVLEDMQGQEGGCTLTGAVLEGVRFTLAHVGDSRGYKGLRGGIEQLSHDHSLVAAMVASGVITAEEAQDHPDRNKILRSLGSLRQEQVGYVQTLPGTLEPGEALLLLSDGVWGEVSDTELGALWLQLANEPQRLADTLIHRALESGAPDNATALIVLRSS